MQRMPDTTIRLPIATRDGLRKYGAKGQSYADILERLMAEVDHKRFLREQLDLLDEGVAAKARLARLEEV